MHLFRFWPSGSLLRAPVAALSLWCAAGPAAAQPVDLWGELPVAGGVTAARDVLTLGDAGDRLTSTLLIDFVRRYANTDLRTASERFERHLVAATRSSPSGESAPESSLPLPLPAFWQETFRRGDLPLLVSMLRSREALLTYHGLMGLDPGSLAALGARPVLLRDIAGSAVASASFAGFGQSLRVGPDGVDTPGEDDDTVWQALVGVPPSDVEPFIRALLTRDGGRLAWFYDTVSDLPAATQRFVLASALPPAERVAAVRAVYSRFAAVEPTWRIDTRPFHRPAFDGVLALLSVALLDDGTAGPAWWPAVFDLAARQGDWSTPGPPPSPADDRSADARWMFDWVFAVPDQARQRFAALRFAQRVFPDVTRESAPHVQAALGAVIEIPSLMFSVERMGVRDLETLGAIARAARAATYAGNESRVLPALGRWQAALGLLEQVQRRAALPNARISALVRSLAAVAPIDTDAAGSIATWINDALLPALVPGRTATAALEDAFLRAATTPRTPQPRAFTWEGLPYIVDEPAVTLRSATAIRRARTGPQLQDLIELHDIRSAVARPTPTLSPAQVRQLIVRLLLLAPFVAQIDHRDDRRIHDFARMMEAVGGTLGERLPQQLGTITAALDAMTEVVVPSLLYALAVSPTAEPVLYPEAWTRHGLARPAGLPFASGRPWREVAWQFPTDYGMGGGTRLTGAFLAVDVALADSQLVRLLSDRLPVPGVIDDPVRRGLVERLVLAGPGTSSGLAPSLVQDLAMARTMVDHWVDAPPTPDALHATLRAAWVDRWRANALVWDVSRGITESLQHLSMTELAALGMHAAGRPGAPSQWSASSRLIDGCLCLAEVRRVTPEQTRGRRLGVQALRPLDITVRLAEWLTALDLDVALVPVLLPMAFQDWIDRSRPAWSDDWDAFSAWPRALPIERVEEYLLHLVSTGVFSPPAPEELPR